jgi:hypothetical protein
MTIIGGKNPYPSPRTTTERRMLDRVLKFYYHVNKRATLDTLERFTAEGVSDRTGKTHGLLSADMRPGSLRTLAEMLPTRFIAFAMITTYMVGHDFASGLGAEERLIVIEAALRLYALQHDGRYPRSLNQIHLKPAIVKDPYRNAPMVYVRLRGKPQPYKLYSVGPNGIDDGGNDRYPVDDILPGM